MTRDRLFGFAAFALVCGILGRGLMPVRSSRVASLGHWPMPAALAVPPSESPSADSPPEPPPSIACEAPLAMADETTSGTDGTPRFEEQFDVSTFQRGNIHTHTRLSDGDSPPGVVYAWYREHGYSWLAVTDHNVRTNPASFKQLERKKSFVMIPGEEITMKGAGRQVHVNALCHKKTIGGHKEPTTVGALEWAIKQVHAQGGVALVNHPNWDWALTADDVKQAKDADLLEIFSGHPGVHQEGDIRHESHEEIWDDALTAGLNFTGVAVDDAHKFGPRSTERQARPGRGWIEVFADEPRRDLICEALAKGRLYASSGGKFSRIALRDGTLTVWPAAPNGKVEFIGENGEVLSLAEPTVEDGASYTLQGNEKYIRARLTLPSGKRAWTQAYRPLK